ncbi:MAG: glycosyltransferase family 2 protein [Proteobacteria bacterium]|nr:glycosyltransferase family 2 protein [Pseudomonadota bacterium]
MPRVSVVVPAYNRERFLEESLQSILRQTYRDFELLVIDDGSSDRTVEIAESQGDARVRVASNGRNLGIPATRNRGLDLASGEFIAWMDSDDVAHPTRLARQVAFLDSHPRHAVVGSYARWVDEQGRPFKLRRRPLRSADIRARMLFVGGFTNTTTTGRRAVLEKYRYRETFALGSDVDVWSRLCLEHEVANLPAVLVDHRTHRGRAGGERGQRDATVHRTKHQVTLDQLAVLGVASDETDIERHLQLRTARSVQPRADTLDWAESWLLGLVAANRERGVYPEPAFERAGGERFAVACRAVSGSAGLSTWRRFAASPLAAPGLRALARTAGERVGTALGGGRWFVDAP